MASGRSLSDKERSERGLGRITLRLPTADLEAIARLAERLGVSRADAVGIAVGIVAALADREGV